MHGEDLRRAFKEDPDFKTLIPFDRLRTLIEFALVCVPPALEERLWDEMVGEPENDMRLAEAPLDWSRLLQARHVLTKLMCDLLEPFGSVLMVHSGDVDDDGNSIEEDNANSIAGFRMLTRGDLSDVVRTINMFPSTDLDGEAFLEELHARSNTWLKAQLERAKIPEEEHQSFLNGELTVWEAFEAHPRLFFCF